MASAKNGKQIRLERRTSLYWRVTFDHPPLNIFGPETIPQLNEIVIALETDSDVKVVVFDSAVDGFFLTHYNFLASLGRAILSQFEVGAGFVPGGGPMARLPRLIGRGRALEVLLGADDISGDLAERYGYVNRALPDAELDAFVEALAMRIASFDKQAIVETKNFVNIASLPPDAEIAPEWDACFASVQRPAAQRRINALLARGLHKPGDVENRLGYYVGQIGR